MQLVRHKELQLCGVPPISRSRSRVWQRRLAPHANACDGGEQTQSDVTGSISKGDDVWRQRRHARVLGELLEATTRKGPACTREALADGMHALESLLPGFAIDLERMSTRDWAMLVLNAKGVAERIVVLKVAFPRADLTRIAQAYPRVLLLDAGALQRNSQQVKELLSRAKDADALVTEVPRLLDPRILVSVLVTINKWWHGRKDPVEVLEMDPDLVARSEACDMPYEPVYVNEDGSWSVPELAYHERRTEWQKWIDQTVFKQE